MNCPLCSRVLEPATLRKENLWCSVCAVEYLPDGVKVAPSVPAPAAAEQAGTNIVDFAPAVQKSVPPVSGAPKTFTVTVGDVTFEATGKVELLIGKTKVTIT